MQKPLEIIYRDADLVAIDKPAGLLVHRSWIDRHETRFAVQLLRDQLGQRVFPVHRLDKPTSGVLLFALSRETAGSLGAEFTAQRVEKTYLAVVRGWTEDRGEIDHPLIDGPERSREGDPQAASPERPALTSYRTLTRTELPFALGPHPTSRYSLLELQPKTGRRHQLRRHCKHIFHPLIGDTRYGEGRHNRLFREQFGCYRLLLHARSLRLRHPWTGAELCFCAELPEDYRQVLVTAGLVSEEDGN